MRWIFCVMWLATTVTACDIPPEVQAELTCGVLCGCFVGPAEEAECNSQCVQRGNFRNLPEDCFECIQAHANACSTLENDCEALCEEPQPDPQEPPPMDGGL